jgi:hypothetical protein
LHGAVPVCVGLTAIAVLYGFSGLWWAPVAPLVALTFPRLDVTPARLGFDSSRYVRPKRRTSSSTLWRECVDGGPLSSAMAYRAPSDAR